MDQENQAPQTPVEPKSDEAANQEVISDVLAGSGLLDSIEAPSGEPVEQQEAPEAQADPLAEFFEQAEDDEGRNGEFPEGTPDWVPGRIAREKRKAEQLRSENESLQSEVEKLRKSATAPGVTTIPGIETEADLIQYEKTATETNRLLSRWIRDYDRNPDRVAQQVQAEAGYDITQEADPVEWLYQKQDLLSDQLENAVPAARQRFEKARQVEQVIANTFPQYSDTSSQFRKQIDAWIGEDPVLKSSTVAPALAAYAIIGKKVMDSRKQGNKPAQTPSPTPSPAPVREQPQQKPRKNQQAEERQKALQSRTGVQNLLGSIARDLKPI